MNDVLIFPALKSGSASTLRCIGIVVWMPFDDGHLERAPHAIDRLVAIASVRP